MTEYAEKLKAMTDLELVDEIGSKVWLSAYAANNPLSKYHDKCDSTYWEAERREKPWLYQQGWNKAWVSAGHELSDDDRERAIAKAEGRQDD